MALADRSIPDKLRLGIPAGGLCDRSDRGGRYLVRHRRSHLARALWCLLIAVASPTSANAQIARLEIHWNALRKAFPTGVCDFFKPGVGFQPSIPWLTYDQTPGGRPLGATPSSRPVS